MYRPRKRCLDSTGLGQLAASWRRRGHQAELYSPVIIACLRESRIVLFIFYSYQLADSFGFPYPVYADSFSPQARQYQ